MEDFSIETATVKGGNQYWKSGKMRDWCVKAMKVFDTKISVDCQSLGW